MPHRRSTDSTSSTNSNHASRRASHDSAQHSRLVALSLLFKKRPKQMSSSAGGPAVINMHTSQVSQANDTESNMTRSNINTTPTAATSNYAISAPEPATVISTSESTPRTSTTSVRARRIYVPKYAARSHASNLAPESSEPPSGRTSNLGTAISPSDMEQLLKSCGQIEKDRWVNEYREGNSRMSGA